MSSLESSAEAIIKSMGHHAHWGHSCGFDFLAELEDVLEHADEEGDTEKPINILLVQPGDIRHILLTISRRRRHTRKDATCYSALRPIHFYILEDPIEVLARDVLQLQVINDYELPIRQRANVFLEVFGNVRVQRRTSVYLDQLGTQLRSLISHDLGNLKGLVDFSMLRYRDRDMLEDAFKAYSRNIPFELDSLMDNRYRSLYAERYDNRKAIYDWDYQYGIKTRASIIHIKQYREWRQSGIAFEFGDQVYSEPNKTLITYAEGLLKKGKDKGLKKEIKGYWGDIVCSPFVSYGVDCETNNKFSEELWDILNKGTGTEQHRHHSVEVSLYNLYCILWEIETGKIYKMTRKNDIYSGLGAEEKFSEPKDQTMEKVEEGTRDDDRNSNDQEQAVEVLGNEKVVEEKLECGISESVEKEKNAVNDVGSDENTKKEEKTGKKNQICNTLPFQEQEDEILRAVKKAETIVESYTNAKVFPMTGGLQQTIEKLPQKQNFFHGAFVSSRGAQVAATSSFRQLMKSSGKGSIIAMETSKFLVPLGKKARQDFNDKLLEYAVGSSWMRTQAKVHRRRRDDEDDQDDVIFFCNSEIIRGKA